MVHSSKPGPGGRASSGLVGNLGKGRGDTNNGQWKNAVGCQMRKRQGALKGDSFVALSTRTQLNQNVLPDPIRWETKKLGESSNFWVES